MTPSAAASDASVAACAGALPGPLVGLLGPLLDRLEREDRLDRLARPLAALGKRALGTGWRRDLASGSWLGHPAHPAAVLLPAGTLLSASVLDATGDPAMTPAAGRLVALGLATALPTALAGWSDWLYTEQAEKRVGLVHAATNAAALACYAASVGRRRNPGRARAASLAGAALLSAGGWLGGHLAYAQGVGVDTTAFQAGPETWTDVAAADDLTEDLRRVEVEGVGLLLTRVDGSVVALADRCTHRGGPLSDGRRVDGCVECPWHASRFDLATGAVRQGPATRPQPVYEVQERAGRVRVRRQEPRSLRVNPA